MRGACSRCGLQASITDFADEAVARDCLALAMECPAPVGRLVVRYLAFFKPAKRVLAWDRLERLLRPLVADIQRAAISRHGRDWPAPLPTWEYALTELLAKADTLSLPLKSHGYLYAVIQRQADSTEAAAEATAEADNQERARQGSGERRPQTTGDRLSNLPKRGKPPAAFNDVKRRLQRAAGNAKPDDEDN